MQGLSTIYQQCLERLRWAMNRLEVPIETPQLHQISMLIVQPMTGPWRFFHTLQHIFEVGGEDDPIEILAALFHDIVYVQVDLCIPFNLSAYLTPFVREVGEKLSIREEAELPDDRTFAAVLDIFDFKPGQVLKTFGGQNEFLSAIVAIKVLEPFLSLEQLVRIAACIELTIPFRSRCKKNVTPIERLHQRLVAVNDRFALELTSRDLVETAKKAVRVSNRDVIGFADATAHFLSNTWNLLPETNHSLIGSSSYTVRDYRVALQKMEGFINTLKPEIIFNQFQGEPNTQKYQFLKDKARTNLAVAKLYLASKLVTIATIESLSYALGLNVPLATMMGIHPDSGSRGIRLENFIPGSLEAYRPTTNLEWQVLNFLEKGRKGRGKNEDYDLDNSPLATFLVKALGFSEIRYQCDRAKGFFDRKLSAKEFLADFDLETIETIVKALSSMFDAQKKAMNRCYSALESFSNTQLICQISSQGDLQKHSSNHNATV
ncbi:hypothetical protein [Zarconia navalis]|uniref:hypothetical protein n=1 Tax=Zarconia navalis TaxID=2992134 RepID=UPI0021F873F3|nr:hypothetical protein [Zarconia navalis]